MIEPFTWRDGERVIHFGHPPTPDLLGGPGYTLLTTRRAAAQLTDLVEGAGALHIVAAGRVDEIAAALRPEITGELLVALGGGRVIDTAKALASADPPRRVAAIPTTLSGAEMTAVHRRPTGVPMDSPPVRPAIVVNDPDVFASQPLVELACSAGNALAHAAEGPRRRCAIRSRRSRRSSRSGCWVTGSPTGATPTDPLSRSARCSPAT